MYLRRKGENQAHHISDTKYSRHAISNYHVFARVFTLAFVDQQLRLFFLLSFKIIACMYLYDPLSRGIRGTTPLRALIESEMLASSKDACYTTPTKIQTFYKI